MNPSRELTFQGLKPNKPVTSCVIIVGKNTYRGMDSVTGVAMIAAWIKEWASAAFE